MIVPLKVCGPLAAAAALGAERAIAPARRTARRIGLGRCMVAPFRPWAVSERLPRPISVGAILSRRASRVHPGRSPGRAPGAAIDTARGGTCARAFACQEHSTDKAAECRFAR